MELKHDRVYAILSRTLMRGLPNLAIAGGDAAGVVRSRVRPASVAHAFVNFPEPPHRSGDEDSDAHHLLNDDFLRDLGVALVDNGRLTIFSDNRRYLYTLARSLGKLRAAPRKRKRATAPTVDASAPLLYRSVALPPSCTNVTCTEDIGGVTVYHGVPGVESGHLVGASSYFDRFWQAGQFVERYFLLLERPPAEK